MNVTESLLKIIELTNKNLEILGMINESFFTKQEHLSTVIDGTKYVIPSYISLENKINHLQAAFNNLVNMPITGEAYMNFDGNSRVIQTRGFERAPQSVDLEPLTNFMFEDSNLFKDMLSPCPYLNIPLDELDADITKVVVKKIVPYNSELIDAIKTTAGASDEDESASAVISYSDVKNIIDSGDYKFNEDYLDYDTVISLPIRKLTCYGEYIVTSIIDDKVDENLVNKLKLQLDESTPTTYTIYDGVATRQLAAGDVLTTYNGSARLQVLEVSHSTRTLLLSVLSGEYINILPYTGSGDVSDYSRLVFYKAADMESDKNLHIPLEEDRYVFISIAPLNERLNTRAAWGDGLFIQVDKLSTAIGDRVVPFRTYYNENVKNIGDTINELAAILPPPLTKLSQEEYDHITTSMPYMLADDDTMDTLQVVQINKHVDDAENVQTIRNLYSQKAQYKTDLDECQRKIASLTEQLSEISFDDMTGSRTAIESQITDLKGQQNNLIAAINTAIDSISQAANDSEVPIEDAKFRIRGYVDIDRFLAKNELSADYENYIRGVKVRYRYKNPGKSELVNSSSIGDFLFTEWVDYSAGPRTKQTEYKNGTYTTKFEENVPSMNAPKYNQVDIPISQGEHVDLQAKILWDFGYPFVSVESDWSDIITVDFPKELVKDVQIKSILDENNDDIETYRFENILRNHGVDPHIGDYVDDQNIRYYHKSESISSGFYTDERRVIPLKDKLVDMNAAIASIQDMLLGSYAESLKVTATLNNTEYVISPDIENVINLTAYSITPLMKTEEQGAVIDHNVSRVGENGAAVMFGTINIKNTTDHTVRLFSMVPGSRDLDMYKSAIFNRINTHLEYAENVKIEDAEEEGEWEEIAMIPVLPIAEEEEEEADTTPYTGGDGISINDNNEISADVTAPIILQAPDGESDKAITLDYGDGLTTSSDKLTINAGDGLKIDSTNHKLQVKLASSDSGLSFEGGGLKVTSGGGTTYTAGDGISIDDSTIAVNLAARSGLDKSASGLTIKVDTTSGLTINSGGQLSIGTMPSPAGYSIKDVAPSGGINRDSGGLISIDSSQYKIKSSGEGLTVDNSGKVKVDLASTPGLEFSSDNKLKVKTKTNGGIDINDNGIYIKCDSSSGISVDDTGRLTLDQQALYNAIAAIIQGSGDIDLVGPDARTIYVADPQKIPLKDTTAKFPPEGWSDMTDEAKAAWWEANKGDVITQTQKCNQFIIFRIKEPYAYQNLGQVRAGNIYTVDGREEQEKLLQNIYKTHDSQDEAFTYVTPSTYDSNELCIQSDATQSYIEIGPGSSLSVPIIVAYYAPEGTDECSYTLGFNLRNSLYNDPLYYQIKFSARHNPTFADMLNSQKASVNNQTKYNPVIR